MGESFVNLLSDAQQEILLFAAVGLAIGGLDDLLVDLVYFARRFWRSLTVYTRHARMTTASLPSSVRPGRIAIFVPAWQEAEVIGPMLRHAVGAWAGSDYRLFVGVYPNDPPTLAAILPVATDEPHIIIGMNARPGPTTKADCLNGLWRAMRAEEAHGIM